MPTEVTVQCATCAGDVDVLVHSDGRVENAHYGNILVAEESRLVEGATPVDDILNQPVEEGQHAVVFTECEECCPQCSSDS